MLHPRTLRARLTVVLLALAAVGLVALAGITYGSQKQFLEQQVDDQVLAAARFAGPQIQANTYRAYVEGTLTSDEQGLATTPTPQNQGSDGKFGPGGGPGDGPPGGGKRDLPLGTYAELRDASGQRVGLPFQMGTADDEVPAPKLPDTLPLNETITVGSVTGDTKYRVRAESTPSRLLQNGTVVVAVPLSGKTDQLQQLLLVDAIVILAILAALGLAASRLVRHELSPLEHIATDADRIAAGELDRRVPEATPGSEVGRLAVALNAMLGRIEVAFAERKASEDRLRTFLSDASHELRTPLASIRGYAELQRTGMIATDEERATAVARIEEQAARMGTLVEDLLALARLDEEREQPTDLVELAVLARDAVADAGSLDAERDVTLHAEADPLVLGQEAKLRQVFTNLLGNAVAHTPPGTPIEVRVAVDAARAQAVVDVDDAGPGVPPESRDKIFERFHREAGGTARTRGPAGAGLGLAVVSGIVEAHGGTVTVGDSPAGGARFSVRLPLVETDEA